MSDSLTPQEILEHAISLEQRAVELYSELSRLAGNDAIRQTFIEFAEEEMGHRHKLEKVRDGEITLAATGAVVDLKLSDYTLGQPLSDTPSYQDILLFVIEQERLAVALYEDLAALISEPSLHSLFLALAAEERKHKAKFEIEYDDQVLVYN